MTQPAVEDNKKMEGKEDEKKEEEEEEEEEEEKLTVYLEDLVVL